MSHHPYHLVSLSPWPLLGSLAMLNLMFSATDFMWGHSSIFLITNVISILLIKFQWWRDVVREGTFKGDHTQEVYKGLQMGMVLFILSEVFFFLSFFWAFFHLSLSSDIHMGGMWPCKGIQSFNPMEIPLLNTLILISSGVSVTWAHHSILGGNKKEAVSSLMLTCLLGVYFTVMQGVEYIEAPFSIADSSYGSTFFMATGFHGLHVIMGTIFLSVSLIRVVLNHFSSTHLMGFEAAAWYWHFVDVVWLFLYLFMYWWSK